MSATSNDIPAVNYNLKNQRKHGLKPLEVFHNFVTRHLSNRNISKQPNSKIWVYPNVIQAFKDLALLSLPASIYKRKSNLILKVQDQPIFIHARNMEIAAAGTQQFWGSKLVD
jgi:hypothetical protein